MTRMLWRNVRRTLARQWMQVLAIGVIVVFSSATYTMMAYGMGGIAEPATTYLADHVQEDFAVEMVQVVTPEEARVPAVRALAERGVRRLTDIKRLEPATFARLMNDRIDAAAEHLGATLELRQFKLLDFTRQGRSHTALVARDARRINLSYLETGTRPRRDDEIAVNRMWALKNGLASGGTVAMGGHRYRITGNVLFPDYTLPVFDQTLNLDTGLQVLVLMTDDAYEGLDAPETFRLAGVLDDGGEVDTVFDAADMPFAIQVVATSGNYRSGAIYDELTQGRVTGLGLSLFIAGIAVVIVTIMMSHLMNAERGQIGVLKALGHSRWGIATPYLGSIVGVALVMLLAGYAVGLALADPLKVMYLDFYLLPSQPVTQNVSVLLVAVGVPALFFTVCSGLIINRLLGQRALDLLRPHVGGSLNALTRVAGRLLRRAGSRTRFTVLHAVRSTGSFVLLGVGMLFATLLITFALMMDGMVDRMVVGNLASVGYRYEAWLDATRRTPEPEPGQESFLSWPYARVGDEVVALHGLEPDNRLYRLTDPQGHDVTASLRHAAVVTRSLAVKRDLAPGDTVRVRVDDEEYAFPVAGVSDEYTGDRVYLDIGRLSAILSDGRSRHLVSGIYSVTEPPADRYEVVISTRALIDRARAMSDYTALMVNVLVGASSAIAASILFVLSAFTVERNFYSISLLKVLGYRRREVNAMLLNSYLVFALVAYAASVPTAVVALDALTAVFVQEYGVILPLELDPLDVMRGLAIVVVIYAVGTWASRRRIDRIPLQEVLKTYGE